MWTPKRVLMLAMGFALFFTAYMVYAHFLGGINGLPPLPDDYGRLPERPDPIVQANRENEAAQKLRIAFGPDCDEVKDRNIKVELQSRGMVFAAEDIQFEEGRVKLTPFSIAIFGKNQGGDKFPEINTVQCHEAKLTFDKPVNNIADMYNRKITGGELSGDVKIINNRRTPQRDDDLSVSTQGPLYYEESLHRVWTKAVVQVLDLQSKPKPMKILGTRMHLYLAAESKPDNPGTPPAAKAKAGSSMKVERVELESDVDMHLWVDARSGFLGAGKNDKEQTSTGPPDTTPTDNRTPPAGQPAQEEKAEVVIATQGPFRYDLLTDRATFDISHHSGPRPNVVTVDRYQQVEDKRDQLQCDHLEIQFRRKNPTGPQAGRDDDPEGLDMESVRATGKEVVLTSDAEVLEAHGSDFFYDKRTHLSTLRGEPRMWALKEGNEIEAPELQLLDIKGAQQATALGEGHIRMLDKKTGNRPLEAQWKKKFVYAKDGPHDLLTLTGDASFVDHEQAQQLEAQLLKVWLEPSKEAKVPRGSDPQRPLPHHVDAIGHVNAVAPDMRVHDTERLIIWFKEVPPAAAPLLAAPPPGPTPAASHVASKPADREGSMPIPQAEDGRAAVTPGPAFTESITAAKPREPSVGLPHQETQRTPAAAAGTAPVDAAANPAKPKKPMDLSARLAEAHVLRSGNKNELEKLWCEGVVRVRQEPSAPDDKGVDIRGDTLHLTHQVDGNILVVTGDHAQVQLDKLYIVGPEVNIDQTTNEAWVNGMGVMRLPSNASFDGTKLSQPADLTIYWDKRMLFNGQDAHFWGGIRAEQHSGHLACQVMQVTLDRKVSLREGDKGKPPAKVQQLVCDRNVWVEDSKREGARVVAFQRIDCPELSVDNDHEKDDSDVNASGPVTVRIFQLGTKDDLVPAPGQASASPAPFSAERARANAQPPKGKEEGEFKLTHVSCAGAMHANNKRDIARFYDKVVVIHVPTDNPNLPIDPNHLPAGYLYMSCETLEVRKSKLPDGRAYQEMRASKKVAIESQEFSGSADVVKYDESKEQVILEGSPGNLAVLCKQEARASEPKTVTGKKITYWRSTGTYHVEEARAIKVAN